MQPNMTCKEFGPMHGVYSADPGDYWELGAVDPADVAAAASCDECGGAMVVVRKIEHWEVVS